MKTISQLQSQLEQCRLCPDMHGPAVHGLPVISKVMLIGQAPGFKEIEVLKPFAWTAGKKLFSWFAGIGLDESRFRQRVYLSAVCRCYPGKKALKNATKAHGDRLPDAREIEQCSRWLKAEVTILKPQLVILVGKLAIAQFMPVKKLDQVIGQIHRINMYGHGCDAIPLPHPSGASTWTVTEPGKSLLQQALKEIQTHKAWQNLILEKKCNDSA